MAPTTQGPRLPPPITESTSVLFSHIPLPSLPSIAYTEFIPTSQPQQHKTIELARQRIVNGARERGKGVLGSLLPIVHIGKVEATLWVFAISGGDDHTLCDGFKSKEKAVEALEALEFDGMQRTPSSDFTPSTLYPCSSQCAKRSTPCSFCTTTTLESSIEGAAASSPINLLPRQSLRHIYALFVDAVRDRLVDDICAASHHTADTKRDAVDPQMEKSGQIPKATRLGNGFLSGGGEVMPAWGMGWEHRSRKRPMVHTALDIHLSSTAIHIRPLPMLTTLLPVLDSFSSSPTCSSSSSPSPISTSHLTPGAPLVLAPYPTPAFYISTHARGAISNLLRGQFWDALTGLGASFVSPLPRPSSPCPTSSSLNPKSPSPVVSSTNAIQESFILTFILLHNPQGEPKGITALWPAHLTFIDTNPSRSHLTTLPDMPGTEMLLTPPRGSVTQPPEPSLPALSPSPIRRRSIALGQLDRWSRTQRSFRALELSSHKRVPGVPINAIAKTAAGYVESVAREREKERERANQERMRREREIKEGKAAVSGPSISANPSAGTSQIAQSPSGTAVAGSSAKTTADAARAGSSWNSVSANFFAKAVQGDVAHSFYPSPPDWDPVTSASGSAASEHPSVSGNPAVQSATTSTNVPSSDMQSQPNSNVAPPTVRDSLDLSGGINLGMGIDLNGMTMGINLGDTMGMMDVDMDTTGIMDGSFGSFADAFTDDDFNFFDTAPSVETIAVSDPLHRLGTDEGGVDGWLASELAGREQNPAVAHQLQHHNAVGVIQHVTPISVGVDVPVHESLLSHSIGGVQMSEDDGDLLPPAPDLMPSSPAKSPWSPWNPSTPSLELNTPSPLMVGKAAFEPIPFGSRHSVADGKYRKGKFTFLHTLPRTSSHLDFISGNPSSPNAAQEDGWKLRYDAITDPRVGVVNRLRGIKRKLPQKYQYPKSIKGRARDEEWESLYAQGEDSDALESSSSEEEDDIDAPEPGQEYDDDSSSCSHPSRPSTPPPPGLPLTATLLYFHFHHAHLLPLGFPMRPAYGDLFSNNDPPPAPMSVPTPVSPAAALGSATERNKIFELLAQAVAKEAVENDAWAEAWSLSRDACSTGYRTQIRREVSQTDLRRISELMREVDGLQVPLPLSEFLEHPFPDTAISGQRPAHGDKLELMLPPWLSIGRAGLVHHMLPPAVRFWEKEGLGPRGGSKDVVAFALFEEGDEMAELVAGWMERVSRAYSTRGFGKHVAGNAGTFERGLVPLQFEAVRKTLPNLMSALPVEPQHVVIYVIAPPSVCSSLKSPALRAIIMSQNRVSKLPGQYNVDQNRVLVHFVPDYLVTDPHTHPTTRHVGLEQFVNSVYNRLLRPTLRQTSRKFWEYNPAFENRFQVPAYVLARKTPPQTRLEWSEEPSLNTLDRHNFLQVGYRLSECKNWLLAACTDERGEAHDVAVWAVPHQNDCPSLNVNWIVSNVWIFATQFAQRAHTEWRIVISKLGNMGENEVEAWISHLETIAPAQTGPTVHVSLVCAQNDIPLPLLCTSQVNGNRADTTINSSSVFVDVSSATYSASFLQRKPIISPDLLCPAVYPSLVAPAVSADESVDPPRALRIGILPLYTTALLRVPNRTDFTTVETLYIHLLYTYKSPKSTLKKTTKEVHADITRNWYELAVLTRERWHFAQHMELPFHLAALELMSEVLDPEVLTDARDVECFGG